MNHEDTQARLDRQASNAKLIAQSRARFAISTRKVHQSEALVRQTAALVPRSAFDPPHPRSADPIADAMVWRGRREQARLKELRAIGFSLRCSVNEAVVASQETRWQARQTRMQAAAQRARMQQQQARARQDVVAA